MFDNIRYGLSLSRMNKEQGEGKIKAALKNKKDLPQPKLQVSLGTLMEIEKWAKRAVVGKTRNAFGPIMKQIKFNKDELFDAVHSLTLAQIMPFREMRRHINMHELNPIHSDFDFVYSLSQRYRTTQENVVERIHHVKLIDAFVKEREEFVETGPFKD